MGKTLNEAQEIQAATVHYSGEQIILPENMTLDDAIGVLKRRREYEYEEVNISEVFDAFPWDGANALNIALTAKFGWDGATATPGFWGDTPPELKSVEVAYGVFKTVAWGRFSLPGIQGYLWTSVGKKEHRVVFKLSASVRRMNERLVRAIFDDVRYQLKHNSIYRGQAIKMRFLNDDGDPLEMPEPKFMDVEGIEKDMVIYSDSVQRAVEVNLFTPIVKVQDLIKNGIPVKRGVLLGGTYGTGKTLAATVASKLAVESGITYLYVPRADELAQAIEFAKQYQSPACVVFCEDIDRALSGERTVAIDDILNIIDGIDTKKAHIITVLTTNDLDAIEPAMLRPGRLDAVIEVTPPDAKAVERLIRLYGGDAIAESTKLAKVGKILAGNIPATIAEVVKRAKLAQVTLNEPGAKVKQIGEEALIASAESMTAQLELLKRRSAPHEPANPLEDALQAVVRGALNGDAERLQALHEALPNLRRAASKINERL